MDLDLQRSMIDRSKLPTAPKAARGPDVDLGRIPNQPPYTAFIGNLPYEATEDLIENFFKNLKVPIFFQLLFSKKKKHMKDYTYRVKQLN